MDKRFADYNFSCVMTGDQTLPAKVHITLVNVHVYFKLNGIYQSSEIVCWYDEKEETLFIDLDKFVNPAIWN